MFSVGLIRHCSRVSLRQPRFFPLFSLLQIQSRLKKSVISRARSAVGKSARLTLCQSVFVYFFLGRDISREPSRSSLYLPERWQMGCNRKVQLLFSLSGERRELKYHFLAVPVRPSITSFLDTPAFDAAVNFNSSETLSRLDRGIQSATKMLPLKRERGVAHSSSCTPGFVDSIYVLLTYLFYFYHYFF